MAACLPVGYVFEPEKEEIVGYFLRTKLSGHALPPFYDTLIIDIDIYTDHPLNILASTKEMRGVIDEEEEGVKEGYFFTPLKKTSAKGKRISRCIKDQGTWLEKAGTKNVYDEVGRVIGLYKYYKFKPFDSNKDSPLNKDEWSMHEYSLLGNQDLVLSHITMARPLKRNHNNSIREIDYEAGTSKRSRVDSTPSFDFNHNVEQENNNGQVLPVSVEDDENKLGGGLERTLSWCKARLDPFELEKLNRLEALLMS